MAREDDVESRTEQQPSEPNAEQTQPAQSRRRGKRRLWLWILVVLAIILFAAWLFWWRNRGREFTDDAQVNGHIDPISARISGHVIQVLVDNNWDVKPGQVLVRLDPRDYQVKVDEAKAALTTAEAAATAAQAGIPLARGTTSSATLGAEAELAAAQAEYDRARVAAEEAETAGIAVAQANLAQAEANNRKAQADLERMRPLLGKQEISKQRFDAFLAAAQVSAAQLRAAKEQLAAARETAANTRAAEQAAQARVKAARAGVTQTRAKQGQVPVTSAQAKSAAARVQQARANLENAELQLSYCTIAAPVAGEIAEKSVEVGQTVSPGQALMAIVQLQDVWVKADFKETQLANVRPGQRAEVYVDTYGITLQGKVHSIAGASGASTSLLPPENATGNFVKVVQRIPVKIVFGKLPPGIALRPGMNVEATIITK